MMELDNRNIEGFYVSLLLKQRKYYGIASAMLLATGVLGLLVIGSYIFSYSAMMFGSLAVISGVLFAGNYTIGETFENIRHEFERTLFLASGKKLTFDPKTNRIVVNSDMS